MAYVGGIRKRLIKDSLYNMVKTSLTSLGWFSVNRQHIPINFIDTAADRQEAVPLNTLALVDANIRPGEQELGTFDLERKWTFYFDFYAENSAIGLHLVGDIVDILAGKISAIGRTEPNFAVYDLTKATPPLLFYCALEDIIQDRAESFPGSKPWMAHWYTARADCIDAYRDDVT